MKAETPIIRVENISKTFPLTTRRALSLRQEARAIFAGWLRSRARTQTETFYALNEVSFKIRRGEGVAIVGRNGSGKTTLLRLLAKIMRPTSGTLTVEGSFTALIGLGTGFHPDLTGRENIFLTAAMYGMPPKQVYPLVDAMIAFADIGDFIDAPIKTYSSGMNARLGFSLVLHIMSEILFIDEIVAVGDAAFQEKCFERITALKAEGRTLLLVSHSPAIIAKLCERALWLHFGRLVADGPADEVLSAYQQSLPEA